MPDLVNPQTYNGWQIQVHEPGKPLFQGLIKNAFHGRNFLQIEYTWSAMQLPDGKWIGVGLLPVQLNRKDIFKDEDSCSGHTYRQHMPERLIMFIDEDDPLFLSPDDISGLEVFA